LPAYLSLSLFINPGLVNSAIPLTSIKNLTSDDSRLSKSKLVSTNRIAQSCTSTEVEQYIAAFRYPWQQEQAVRQLVASCNQTAIPALTRVLQTEPDAGVRQTAAAALGYIGGATATKALIVTLKTDSAPTVRKTAADALGYIRTTTAVNPLINALEDPKESTDVREAAAEALGLIGGTTATKALIATLQNTRESLNLRQAAVKALQQIGETATGDLVMTLEATDLRTRYWAVAALSEINSPRSINALEANKVKVTKILEDAYQADIVEFDRVPAGKVPGGTRKLLPRKPIVCKISWMAQHWARCR
jgi:HEAT repeat protein